jgi:hypothetical protein
LFILLDAIDQLEEATKPSFHFDAWLTRYLPRDVHIFVSFIPNIERVNLKDIFLQLVRYDETALFTVPRLRPNDCEDIIRTFLSQHQRQLSDEQNRYLLKTIETNPQPLYLKLLINIARTWTCFREPTLQQELTLPKTIEETIEQLFARLENRHGKQFVSYSLAYLAYGLNGISEAELEDCLSINDDVLNEIYTHHNPPIPQSIHVPSLLCQSLLHSIQEYLTRKRTHNKHILSFYHRKFFEATRKSYTDLRERCHAHLIELYCHDQSTYKRTILLNRRNNHVIEHADRLINCQLTNTLNKRKLIALPYHCLEIGSTYDEVLRTKCLFNLQFLSCQWISLGHTLFLDNIQQCLRLRPHWTDLKRLYYVICSIDDQIKPADIDATLLLAEQILGFIDDQNCSRLYGNNESSVNSTKDLQQLLHQCRQYVNGKSNSFRSIYAGFPHEMGALAWTCSSVTHILFINEFFALVVLVGAFEEEVEDEYHFISTCVIGMIDLQTGKVCRTV